MAQLKPADLASEVHRLGVENQQLILRVNGLEAQLHGLRQEVLMLRGTQNPLQMGPNTSQPPHLALPGFAPPGYAMTTHHQGQVPNARFLPFVLEDIAAAKRRIKGQTGMQQCIGCQKPRGLPACFRAGHWNWCKPHQAEVLPGHIHSPNGPGCLIIYWEEVSNWAELVRFSYAGGQLGKKGVKDLDSILNATE